MESEAKISIAENEWLVSIMKDERRETKSQQRGPKIPRVPQIFRRIESNKECYEPAVVSIGPYHRKLAKLQEMEESKVTMVRQFVEQSGEKIEEIYQIVVVVAKDARLFYVEDESFKLDDIEFTRMLFLDSCFVIQFMFCLLRDQENLKMSSHVAALVTRDMLLLENQVPFLVLMKLLKLKFGDEKEGVKLIKDFTKDVRAMHMPHQRDSCWKKIPKFFCKTILQGAFKSNTSESSAMEESNVANHLLEFFHMHFVDEKATVDNSNTILYRYRPVMELRRMRIHFKPSRTSKFTDVQLKSTWLGGILQIPPLTIDDSTKSMLLNLVAYEACFVEKNKLWVTSYICFMDSLIDHAEDVRELRKRGILLVTLGSEEEVAKLFNEVANYLVPNPGAFKNVKMAINKQRESSVKAWVSEWKNTYFRSPWTIIAVIAASFGLTLTAIQTYYAIYPAK